MEKCLNLCDIINEKYITNALIEGLFSEDKRRVYFGSYFCSRYFMTLHCYYDKLVNIFFSKEMRATLVIPVFTENYLDMAKKLIRDIVSYGKGCLDEITVNDLGMLNYIKNNYTDIRVNIGRLFFRDPRDVRMPEYTSVEIMPAEIKNGVLANLSDGVLEVDETNDFLRFANNSVEKRVAIHYPYCFMTSGNICKYASVHLPIDKKFRANGKCELECQNIYECFRNESDKTELYRIGRTIYFKRKNRACFDVDVNRMIFFPFDEKLKLEKKCYENNGSVK